MGINQDNGTYNCNWRWRTNKNDPLLPLLLFIEKKKLHPGLTKHQLIINALTAFYLPQASQTCGETSPEEQLRIVYDAIEALTARIQRLRHEYKLPALSAEVASNTVSITEQSESIDEQQENQISPPPFISALSTTIEEVKS